MKKYILLLAACLCIIHLSAQTEASNSLPSVTEDNRYKEIGGFLLDMSPVMMTPPPIQMPLLDFRLYDTTDSIYLPFNPESVKINTNITWLNGTSVPAMRSSILSLLYPGIGNSSAQWQGTSYRLKNGVHINTYGEYDADGYKRYNPAALPWERNNFNAAFEVKSANGKFGIRVEMNAGRIYP